jgi:hypothetical protein
VMISLSALFRRMRGAPVSSKLPDTDEDQLRHLHRHLIRALDEHDHVALLELLAEDAQLRLERKVDEGRTRMLVALGNWMGVAQISAPRAHLRWLTADVALQSALWFFDSPARGRFTEQISCLCVRRQGRWWVVQIRQESVPA